MNSAGSALLVVDLQQGFFTDGKRTLYNKEGLIKKTKSLIEKFRAVWSPVIFVQHDGPKGSLLEPETPSWAFHAEIQPMSREVIVRKTGSSAFANTSLRAELEKRQVDTIVVTGLQTELCIDSTIRHASFLGYKVIAVRDAHSTFDSSLFTAPQIIAHHNMIWENEFAESHDEEELSFAWQACNL